MGDEMSDAWAALDEARIQMTILEGIADRLAATCADPMAVEDFRRWKAGD